jgi:3-oxoacyl-(acyl-carrier-protein) synthase
MTASPIDGKQRARAIMLALEDANVQPEEVDYISAHGSSTPINDSTETVAIKRVFGEHAYKLAISSIKSMIGHALGGASGIQAAACALTVAEDILPPTINYEFWDIECDLDYVPNIARKADVNVAVQNASGFSGKNSALVMRKL